MNESRVLYPNIVQTFIGSNATTDRRIANKIQVHYDIIEKNLMYSINSDWASKRNSDELWLPTIHSIKIKLSSISFIQSSWTTNHSEYIKYITEISIKSIQESWRQLLSEDFLYTHSFRHASLWIHLLCFQRCRSLIIFTINREIN